MDKIEKRPKYEGASITTPNSSTMIGLLGPGTVYEGLALTRDEWEAVQRLYHFKPEKPNKKPPPPKAPNRADFKSSWDYDYAVRNHEQAMKAHANWEDPIELMQAGADRNAIRHAAEDGLRMLAWIAKHVEPGQDPLKTLVQLTSDAGWDVNGSDVEWAEGTVEEDSEGDEA